MRNDKARRERRAERASDDPGYDLLIHTNPDAQAWAKFFVEMHPNLRLGINRAGTNGDDGDHEGTMIGWFANAMMAMHDWLRGGGPINGDHAQYLLDHPETAGTREDTDATRIRVLEQAAMHAWDELDPREQKAYVRAHPHSRFANMQVEAPRMALEHHMRACGYQRNGGAFVHPTTRRSIKIATRGRKALHLVVTQANGDVKEVPTTSLRRAKRVVSDMARSGSVLKVNLRNGAGSLHAHLGVPRTQNIPVAALRRLAASTHPLSTRAKAVLALQRKPRELEWDENRS
jgi:hypothetical protein